MANPWDDAYSKYSKQLKSGDITADFIRETYGGLRGTDPLGREFKEGYTFADRVIAIHQELLDQQQRAGGKIPISGGNIGKDDAAWDTAFRLAQTGTDSIYDIGQRTKEVERYDHEAGAYYPEQVVELYHKPTGAEVKLPSMRGFDNVYQLQFTSNGTPVAMSSPKPSGWVDFRESQLRPMVNFAAPFIPGAGPWIAAANAAYAASKGDWERALLSGLSAAVPLAGKLGASASTVSTLNNVRLGANALKILSEKDLLSAALMGADLAGISDVAGVSLKDIKQGIGFYKALQSEDPMAIVRAAATYASKDGGGGTKTVSSGEDDTVNLPSGIQLASADGGFPYRAEGAGLPIYAEDPRAGNIRAPAGYTLASREDPSSDEPARYDDADRMLPRSDGSYFDVTQNAWFKPTGGFDEPITDLGEIFIDAKRPAYEFDFEGIYQGANAKNTPVDDLSELSGLLERPRTELTDDDVREIGGATPTAAPAPDAPPVTDLGEIFIDAKRPAYEFEGLSPDAPPVTDLGEIFIDAKRPDAVEPEPAQPTLPPASPTQPTKPTAPARPVKPAAPVAPPKQPSSPGFDLNALLALLNQQGAPTVVSSGQDNSADVQLMEQIFGTTLSAPPAGDSVTQARELARLLRS
jgi:hypothetical protein